MEYYHSKQAIKDIQKLPKQGQQRLLPVYKQLTECQTIAELTGCKKLQGSSNAYRIRVGDYRICLLLENNKVKISRVLHRKEVYRYFP